MFTVAKAILEVLMHGFARVERNTQRFVIIVLETAAVKLAHKSEGSEHKIFQISARLGVCSVVDSSFSACGLRAHRVHQDMHPAFLVIS